LTPNGRDGAIGTGRSPKARRRLRRHALTHVLLIQTLYHPTMQMGYWLKICKRQRLATTPGTLRGYASSTAPRRNGRGV